MSHYIEKYQSLVNRNPAVGSVLARQWLIAWLSPGRKAVGNWPHGGAET